MTVGRGEHGMVFGWTGEIMEAVLPRTTEHYQAAQKAD